MSESKVTGWTSPPVVQQIPASGACSCQVPFQSNPTSHTLHYQTLSADPSRIQEGGGYETTSIFQAKKRQRADSPVVTAITKFKFSGHVVLIFCILTVAVGQIQTCSPTFLNHIRSTVLIQRTHSQGFAAHTELIRTCSEQSDTNLQQLQYRYATANTPVSHHAGTKTVSQMNVFCCVTCAIASFPGSPPRTTTTTVKEGESLVPFRTWCAAPSTSQL